MVSAAAVICFVGASIGRSEPTRDVRESRVRPRPLPAATALRSALRTHRLVAIGELHGWQRQHTFFRSPLNARRFAAAIDDIVIEFGNSRYQEVGNRISGA
jgi:hypothetical protein